MVAPVRLTSSQEHAIARVKAPRYLPLGHLKHYGGHTSDAVRIKSEVDPERGVICKVSDPFRAAGKYWCEPFVRMSGSRVHTKSYRSRTNAANGALARNANGSSKDADRCMPSAASSSNTSYCG